MRFHNFNPGGYDFFGNGRLCFPVCADCHRKRATHISRETMRPQCPRCEWKATDSARRLAALLAMIERGREDVKAGRVISHEDLMAELMLY